MLLYEELTCATPFDPQALISKGIDECRRTIREQEPARPSNRLATMLAADLTTTAQNRRTEAARLIHLMQGDLDWIVMKCLEKDRSRRYDTAVGLATDVLRYLNDEAVLARPPSGVYRLRKFLQKNRAPVAAAASIAILLVIGSTVSIWFALRATKAEREATANAEDARQQAARAEVQYSASRLNEYVADIGLAQQSLKDGNLAKAVQLLEKHLPTPGEPDLRGFEWRFLWELSRGDEHDSLPRQDAAINCLAVSPDGRLLAVCARDVISIWNLETRTRVADVPTQVGTFTERAASGGGLRRGREGETATPGPPRFPFRGYDSLVFVDGGRTLVAGSRGTLRRWNTATWTELVSRPGLAAPLAASPDGRMLAASRRPNGPRNGSEVAIVETATWTVKEVISDARDQFAFSPDGTRIVADGEEGLKIWSLTGAPPVVLESSTNLFDRGLVLGYQSDRMLAFSPDGRHIVAPRNTADGQRIFYLTVWDAITGRELGTLPESPEQIEHTGVISALAFSADSKLLATGSMDHSIRLWDLGTRKLVDTLEGHLNEVWTLAFAPDGKRLVSGAKDGTVNVWPEKQPTEFDRISNLGFPLGFSQDSQTLATVTRDGIFSLVNLATRDPVRQLRLSATRLQPGRGPGRERPLPLGLSRDLSVLAQASANGAVRFWQTTTGETNDLRVADHVIESLVLSPSGRNLITKSRGKSYAWWDVRAGTNTLWDVQARWLAFSPDDRLVVTVPFSAAPQIWSAADRSLLATLELPEGVEIFSGCFSEDGSLLALTCSDHTIGIWDTTSGKLLGICTGHKQPAFSVAFSPDGRTLASASADSTMRLWNVATQQELLVSRRLGAGLWELHFSPDGQWLVGASGDPQGETIHLFRAPAISDASARHERQSIRARLN